MDREARALFLLWAGAGLGLSLAVASLSHSRGAFSGGSLPAGAVALVNGVPIGKADYLSVLSSIAESEGHEPTPKDKQAALDRLVDDELVVEHGLDLGMVRGDPRTHDALLSAVTVAERAAGEAETPSTEELRRYYARILEELRRPGKMRLRQIVVRARDRLDDAAAFARAEQARRRLGAGEPFELIDKELGTPGEKALPDRSLSSEELRSLAGPVTLERALELEPGQVSDVVGTDGVFRVLRLEERGPPETPPFETVRETVLFHYRRNAADVALGKTIAGLRAVAQIRVAKVLP